MNETFAQARKGAVAGAVATVLMSAVMLIGQKTGRVGKLPPKKIVQESLRTAGVRDVENAAVTPLVVAAHLGYGVGVGAAYPLTLGRMRGVPRALTGCLFGLAVWAVSYEGWVPALGIMPPAHRDRPHRTYTMAVAHAVYGAVLGMLSGDSPPSARGMVRDAYLLTNSRTSR
jgi:hypothetical protein